MRDWVCLSCTYAFEPSAAGRYHRSLEQIAASGGRVRLADYHQLTYACVWDNCTADGGHRGRFVNRGKAQVLLAQMCPERRKSTVAGAPLPPLPPPPPPPPP